MQYDPAVLRLTATTLVVLAFVIPATAASGYEVGGPSPGLLCVAAKTAALSAIEATLQPASGTEVSVGATVAFSASASKPVTFKVAASPALAPPLIDEGTAQPGGGKVSFLSSRTAAASGAVYWDASFSTAALPDCASFAPGTVASPVRVLNVLAAPPAAQAAPAPAPAPSAAVNATGCIVPKLRGMRLATLRASLRRHGCRLGHVTRPARAQAGPLVVTRQGLAPGARRPAGTAVVVTVGRARPRKGDHR
jgi:hypothetical protein